MRYWFELEITHSFIFDCRVLFPKAIIMRNLIFTALLLTFSISYGQQTLQERLGYAKDARLLILHADDLGMCHSENAATFYSMEHGSVNSAAIMMPTGWVMEVADYQHKHPTADFGLHLTLTSEWDFLKWGPVAGRDPVPGLVNAKGYLFSSVDSVLRAATAAEVEKELRAQIEKAKQLGIDFTHLDSHMGTLFTRPDYLQVLIKLGREYKVPVLLSKVFQQAYYLNIDSLTDAHEVVIDMIYTASPQDYKNGMEKYYTSVLKSLKPGVSELIFHVGYDDSELQAATINHEYWGARWRQADFDFFTSENCKKLLKEQSIQLITWREIRDKVLR
jgi:chitin disaccharide deacetylase